jgi:chromosome segregation ATPase
MKKSELKDYNRLLRAENEALREILQMAADSLSDGCRCGEIKLLQEENTELVKDLNDLQADWAAHYTELLSEINNLNTEINFSDMTLQEFENELDEKGRTIRDLEEQILNLNAAAAPKASAPPYAPGYKRKGGK